MKLPTLATESSPWDRRLFLGVIVILVLGSAYHIFGPHRDQQLLNYTSLFVSTGLLLNQFTFGYARATPLRVPMIMLSYLYWLFIVAYILTR
jgi:hypothetical protein